MAVPFHALAVHFAVAFTALWFFFELAARISAQEHFRMLADWLLGFGIAAVGVAVISGFQAEDNVGLLHSDGSFVPAHKVLGITIFCGMIVMGLWRRFALKKNQPALHIIYLVLGLLIIVTLYRGVRIGSQMVYLQGIGIGTAFPTKTASDSLHGVASHANFYICPNCDIVRRVPGRCPKCGKELVGVELATSTTPISEHSTDSLLIEHMKTVH